MISIQIFIKYLLYFEPFSTKIGIGKEIDFTQGYSKKLVNKIKKTIEKKYLSKSQSQTKNYFKNNFKNNNMTLFPAISVNDNIKLVILEYLKIINNYMLVPTPQRKPAQYILDKIIIFEKYKDDLF